MRHANWLTRGAPVRGPGRTAHASGFDPRAAPPARAPSPPVHPMPLRGELPLGQIGAHETGRSGGDRRHAPPAARRRGWTPEEEQRFGPVDVADAAHGTLVEQQLADLGLRRALCGPLDDACEIEGLGEHVRAEARQKRGMDPRPAEASSSITGALKHTAGARSRLEDEARLGCRAAPSRTGRVHVPRARHLHVRVQHPLGGEPNQQVLAGRLDLATAQDRR